MTNKVCKALTKMYMKGIAIDKDALAQVKKDFVQELNEIEGRLQEHEETDGDTINLNSPEQVSQGYLF